MNHVMIQGLKINYKEQVFHAPWVRPEKMRRLAHMTERKVRLIGHILSCFSWIVLHEDWSYWESRLNLIRKPVRLLWGTDDHLFTPGENVRLQRSIPYSEFMIVDNAGHLAMLEAPEQVASLAKSFFSRFVEKAANATSA